jgi:hypothetical protein
VSRYLLLLLLTLPFILASILTAVTQYKLGHSTKRRATIQICLWIIVFIGLALAKSFYEVLSRYGLTDTDSLSLFDVVQITAIIMLFYGFNRMRLKIEAIEKRFENLHQELSIRLSKKD